MLSRPWAVVGESIQPRCVGAAARIAKSAVGSRSVGVGSSSTQHSVDRVSQRCITSCCEVAVGSAAEWPRCIGPATRGQNLLREGCALHNSGGPIRPLAAAALAVRHKACRIGSFDVTLPVGARCFAVKARNRGNVYVSRKVARANLEKTTKRHPDPTLLLPPYVSAAELRVIFRLDYAGVFRLLGVRRAQSKYFWKDHEGREFETSAKRKVMVPFEIAAIPAQGLGFRPQMLDVQPDWEPTVGAASRAPVPVVAVLGHINHGKTTLLDTLCGTSVAASEAGGITQEVRAMTGEFTVRENNKIVSQAFVSLGELSTSRQLPTGDENPRGDSSKRTYDASRITLLDTPGHEAFELQRGRTMAAADTAVVVVSVERGAEVQTEEVLLHAARWKVPVVFALNKIDLPDAHVELTRAELRRQCQRLHEQGLVDIDWTREAEQAVPISALRGVGVSDLMQRVQETLDKLPSVPAKSLAPPTKTPGLAKECKNVTKRTDFLVGIEPPPIGVAVVIESEKGADQGEHVLTLLVRQGKLMVDQFFVVGTCFGRITYLAVADGSGTRCWKPCHSATAGVAVQIMGLRPRFGGDCAPDDLFFALPSERAWRLSEHRRRLEALTALQIAGPDLEVPWEHDSYGMGARTQAAFERDRHDHPEKHSVSAYERRWSQPAVEELASDEDFGAAGRQTPVFSTASRRSFADPFNQRPLGMAATSGEDSDDDVTATIEPVGECSGGEVDARTAGRRSTRRSNPDPSSSRFAVLSPAAQFAQSDDEAHSQQDGESAGGRTGGGRRSSTARAATGAWTQRTTGQGVPREDFVYYTDRKDWTEEANIDSTRVTKRWQERDAARWQEEERREQFAAREKAMAEAVRREVFGEATPSESSDEEDSFEEHGDAVGDADDEVAEPLPQRNVPVVPMILKTRNVGQFDVLMDEVERLQEEHGVRVVIVHGGLGPVIPKDVVHAEVEKSYGFCPIYAFQVGVHPVAAGQAQKESIDVRRFDVFTDLVADVAARCGRINSKEELREYTESLRRSHAHR